MYKKIVERTRSARPKKKKVAKKSSTSTTWGGEGKSGKREKNCYKWQLATPFDEGKEHTEGGGQKKSNTHT